jgi:hypothetical protein
VGERGRVLSHGLKVWEHMVGIRHMGSRFGSTRWAFGMQGGTAVCGSAPWAQGLGAHDRVLECKVGLPCEVLPHGFKGWEHMAGLLNARWDCMGSRVGSTWQGCRMQGHSF